MSSNLNCITRVQCESTTFESDRVAHLRALAKMSFADKIRWVEVLNELAAAFDCAGPLAGPNMGFQIPQPNIQTVTIFRPRAHIA